MNVLNANKKIFVIGLLAFVCFTDAIGQQLASYDSPTRGEFPAFKVLAFSRTEGFRHESISAGLVMLNELGATNDFTVDATEDDAFFTSNDLSQYQAIVFLNTTGDVLDPDEEAAVEAYVMNGGGWVGVHSAADTEYDWVWYGGLVGAYFDSHPVGTPTGSIKAVDRVHPASAALPPRLTRTDEWYNYRTNPRGAVHVLATLDESTYAGGNMGSDHPISWCSEYAGGRSFYTGMGHTSESYDEPLFRDHVLQGLLYAAGVVQGDCGATVGANFEKKVLDANTDNPMSLEITPDGRVFYVERDGRLRVYSPTLGTTATAGTINVTTTNEDGLLGIALDPGFETNSWIYLFYSPAGATPKQHVSRFTMNGNLLDAGSEEVLLEIPVQRSQCCHSSGELEFDSAGNLYISLGDNTNPFDSNGYAPIDERSGREPWDAQGSSGNANDLRGKILRITPQADGTYTIPGGNLFPADGSVGRPEIYVMGVRNPFRFAIDPFTDWLYFGDVGPDAGAVDPNRGPIGADEWNQARAAGNYGWPYCVGPNAAYVDYNFATQASGAAFDCAGGPTNDSPNNTGVSTLPPAVSAWIWYPYGESTVFPEIPSGGGRTAMAGPTYAFDENVDPSIRFPEYYSRKPLLYEWSRDFILEAVLDDNGDLLALQRVLPNISLHRPISMKYGPDGALYVIEWGTGFGGNNDDSQVVRIEFVRGSRSPVVFASADVTSGGVPLTVQFSSSGTYDPDPGDVVTYSWDFDGDLTPDSQEPNPSYVYETAGTFVATLTVEDLSGNRSTASVNIVAGNSMPTVAIAKPVNGGFFDWGDDVAFEVSASDPEDGSTDAGTIDCGDLVFQPFIGHDDHSHPLQQYLDCSGVFPTEAGHGSGGDNVFQVVEVSYTDNGGAAGPLTAREQRIIRPKRLEAEHFTSQSGIQVEATGDSAGGGENVGFIEDGDNFSFDTINLSNISAVTYRVASAGPGGIIDVRVGSPSGALISTTHVEPTGQWQTYREVTAPITDPGGTNTLFFVFRAAGGTSGLFNINWMEFIGDGISVPSETTGSGLFGKYYSNEDFTGRDIERLDPKINFDWGVADPFPLFSGETFSARWAGWIQAEYTEAYTFYTRSTDGMRLWVNDQLLIDRWVNQSISEHASATVDLTAGEKYPIRVEYFENTGDAQAHLFWRSTSTAKEIVPTRVLFPDSTSNIATESDVDLPIEIERLTVYPNPSNGLITVRFENAEIGDVRVELLDLLGRRLEILVDEKLQAGAREVKFDGSGLAIGSYIFRLQTSAGSSSKMIVIVR